MALIKGKQLKDSAVTTAKIADANVTTAKLADDAVTADKLASSAVVTASIVNANVTTDKLADSAVSLAKLADLANLKVLGNVSGSAAAPAAIEIDTDISTVSGTDNTLASAKAIKSYVDSVATGLDVKKSVRVATTANLIHSPTYNNGTSGVGATLTAGSNNAFYAIDGMGSAISVGERILVKNQTTAEHNGIYTLTTAGGVGAAWVLTRATDADSASEVTSGLFTFVEEGTTNGDSGFVLTTNGSITLGSTDLDFSRFSSYTVSSLNDVNISSLAVGQILSWSGSAWVNDFFNIVNDTSPQLGGNLDVNGKDIVSTSNGDIELDPNGSGVVVFKGNATKGSGQFKLNCEDNSHAITLKGPPHSAAASYTLTFPNSAGADTQVLQTDGSGNLSWTANLGGSSSTSYSEVLGNGTATPLGAITASTTPQLVTVGDEQTCTTGTDSFTGYANGDYCIVTANPNSVTGTTFTNSTGITLINASSTSSAVPATQANNAGAIFKIDNISTFGGANINGIKFKKIYTPAVNISSSARSTLQVHINGLLQQNLGTNTANLHSGLAFQAVNTGATSGITDTDVAGALTSGTHFLVFANINFNLETDDHILVSYTV